MRLVDIDRAAILDRTDDCDMTQRHTSRSPEVEDRSGFRRVAARVNALRVVPPVPRIAAQRHGGSGFRESDALNDVTGPETMPVRRGDPLTPCMTLMGVVMDPDMSRMGLRVTHEQKNGGKGQERQKSFPAALMGHELPILRLCHSGNSQLTIFSQSWQDQNAGLSLKKSFPPKIFFPGGFRLNPDRIA
jgi:hypothetical protein